MNWLPYAIIFALILLMYGVLLILARQLHAMHQSLGALLDRFQQMATGAYLSRWSQVDEALRQAHLPMEEPELDLYGDRSRRSSMAEVDGEDIAHAR